MRIGRRKQIDRICKLVRKEWLKNPEYRFGQFLMNRIFGNTGGRHTAFIFFKLDRDIEAILRHEDTG